MDCPVAVTVTVLEKELIIVSAALEVTLSAHATAYPSLSAQADATIMPQMEGTRRPEDLQIPQSSSSIIASPIVSSDYLTISLNNNHGRPLSIFFGSNAGGPSPVGNPSATSLAQGSPTHYTFPTGWAGRIYVGPDLNPEGSKIEASYTGPPDIDVGYVDGYTVPVTCSSRGQAVAGCNLDLFSQTGIPCDHLEGPVCLNPAKGVPDGPAPPFFAACQGAAYTYPNDNEANASNLQSRLITCCIGTSCEAPLRQKFNQSTIARRQASRYRSPEHHARHLASVMISGERRRGSSGRHLPLLAPD